MTVTGPLQIVPDVDDEQSQKREKERIIPVGNSELEVKLDQVAKSGESSQPKDRSKLIAARRRISQTPIRSIGQDAQTLTSAEMMAHRHLLPQ